ncbi:lipoprotein insertase outer membrane protein LolB [Undibacterium sp.]|jgi:outer membrane lipoprotein LolB|uniref:lipoprotein insertase outer membrane protein LolB n=1 Tax=Undibacterium sp. TaxID=1914977 RepID=UPI002CBA92B3|nr:lipoprotein insertase outer membrane protein LolB [Undibacterium sp.]HTD02862.1 lipoprotein insertase outer membrane protein LolB [Undibacterium sp.]
MQNTRFRSLLLMTPVVLGLLLSGCAGLATRTPAQAGSGEQRIYHEDIELSGRLLVLYQQDEKEQSLPGSFEWKQDRDSTMVTLLSPLGQIVATITVDAGGATLVQAKQPPKHASDLDSLMRETLGWPMPVAGMRDWLQGFVRNAQGDRTAVAANNDATMRSDGWQLRYASWQDDYALPKRIDLNRYTAQAGNVTLRVVIDPQKAQ